MAGGIGSRFWPMSTPERPKQFVDVLGTGRTFIQMTLDRFKGIIPMENVWVVTSQRSKTPSVKGYSVPSSVTPSARPPKEKTDRVSPGFP